MAIRDVPGYAIYILIYEWTFNHMRRLEIGDRHAVFANLMAGGLAGVISWAIMAPTDVVKSLIQADVSHTKYRGCLHCVQHTYVHFGIKAFYAGCAVNCIRAFPVNAVTFLVYSKLLRKLNTEKPSDVRPATRLEDPLAHIGLPYHISSFDFDPHVGID